MANMKISGIQLLLARTLLGWNQEEAERKAGVSKTTIKNIEKGHSDPQSATLEKLVTTYSLAGVEFTDGNGVRQRERGIIELHGREGFNAFLDDLYETLLHKGGEACIYNIDARHWPKWAGAEKWAAHVERMTAIKDKMKTKILIREGDNFLPASSYAEYRWTPADEFNEETIYSYGEKFATLTFNEDMVNITVQNNKQASSAFRTLYNLYWETAKKP